MCLKWRRDKGGSRLFCPNSSQNYIFLYSIFPYIFLYSILYILILYILLYIFIIYSSQNLWSENGSYLKNETLKIYEIIVFSLSTTNGRGSTVVGKKIPSSLRDLHFLKPFKSKNIGNFFFQMSVLCHPTVLGAYFSS